MLCHTLPFPKENIILSFNMCVMQIIGFPFFESQAKWISQLLSGKRTLPSWDDMMQSIKDFYHSREVAGIPKHNAHDIGEFEVKNCFSLTQFLKLKNYLQSCDCID